MNFSANLDAIGILTITVDIDADVDLNAIRDTLRGKVPEVPTPPGKRFTYREQVFWAVPEHAQGSCLGCVFAGQGCPTDNEQREQLGQTCYEAGHIFVGP